MTATHDARHIFIVRVWFEPREIEGAALQLRGSVEHVPSGERRSVKALEEVMAFMVRFLPAEQPAPRRGLGPCQAQQDEAI